jgi:regulator of protease activity HflC (stomatin/prohibitin superfamily)
MDLSWLSELLRSFSQVLPRPLLLLSNQWGVYFRFGRNPQVVGPRPILFLPLIEHIETLPNHEVPLELFEQTLTTKDGRQVTIQGSLLVRIVDPVLLIRSCGTQWDTVATFHARSVFKAEITAASDEELREFDVQKCRSIIAKRLRKIGVRLLKCDIMEASASWTIKHSGINT